MSNVRSRSRSAARLAAVQALYQMEMEATPLARLLHEFHQHRLGATIGDVTYADAEIDFFDDVVTGADARGPALFSVTEEPGRWVVRQTLDDPRGDHDWVLDATVDLAASDAAGTAVLRVEAVHMLG